MDFEFLKEIYNLRLVHPLWVIFMEVDIGQWFALYTLY